MDFGRLVSVLKLKDNRNKFAYFQMNSNTLNFITLKVDTHIFRVIGIIKAVGVTVSVARRNLNYWSWKVLIITTLMTLEELVRD